MPVVKLDSSFIANNLTCPQDKSQVELCCNEIKGLYVLVTSKSSGQGTFYFRYKNSAGKTCHQKIGRTADISLADARKQAKALRAEIALGADPRGEQKAKRAIPTLTEFFDDTYLPHAKVHKRSWKRDVQLFARIKEKFGYLRLDQISKQQMSVFHANLLSEGLSASSADHHPKMLRRLYAMSLEYGLLDKNPLANFKLFNHDNKVEHYLDDVQLGQLMDILRTDSNRAVCNIAILLLGTGCRLNEILSCKKSDIDVPNRVLKIAANNSKSKRIRTVPLNDASLDIIYKQFEDTEGFEYLFINHKTGLPYSTIMKVWTRLRNKAGLPHLRLHDLRHSFASFLVNSGRTLYEVQQILGHSQSIVTERYAHLSTKTLQDASNSASVIIQGAIASSVAQQEKLESMNVLADVVALPVIPALPVEARKLDKDMPIAA